MPTLTGILDPLTQFAIDNSKAGVTNTKLPVVIAGQAINSQPFALYPCTSVAQARNFAGRGSHLSRIFEAYFANDQIGPIYLLPFADASGSTAAVGTMLVTGTASANGTLPLYIAGQAIQVGVAATTTPVAQAALIVAAVNAVPDLPVAALAIAAGDTTLRKVQFTAKNAGTLGNGIDIRLGYQGETTPAGCTYTIVAMAGGATDPDLTTIAPLIGDAPMRALVHPYSKNAAITSLMPLMDANTGRWSPLRGGMGHCFTARSDSTANLQTYGVLNNDPHTCVFAYETGSPTPVWEAAGIWAGSQMASFRGQPNAPTTGLPLIGFSPPPVALAEINGGAFSRTTRNILLGMGLGVARYPTGGPAVDRAPTTYQTNAFGQPDASYFDTQTMYQLMAIQDFIRNWEHSNFAQCLVADDGTKFGPGIKYTTPSLFMAGMVDLYNQMQFAGLVEDADAFVAASSVTRNLQYPGELDVLWAPFLISGLYMISNTIQFRSYSAAAAASAQSAAQ